MEIIGIVCEYNPFHNGHLYHINKIKELYKDSIIILILNGYFLERGEISILNKQDKTEIALENGIDLVIELPFVYGTQSADIFAAKSIDLLNLLQAKKIVFGSETNDISILKSIANYQINNSNIYNENVKKYLAKGLNYPTAMAKALNIDFDFNPNDLLGISYIKRIIEKKYNIDAISIKRTNDYLDTLSNEAIVSATNIREKIKNNENITPYLPINSLKKINIVDNDKYFELLKYKIITEHDLSIYLDVDEGIENRLKKIVNKVSNIDELIKKVKSKRYTYNKISRMLIHILIGLTKEDNKKLELTYIKVLGFNNKGKNYLKSIKKELNLNIDKESLIYQYELKSALIYDILTNNNNAEFELKNIPLKMN